MSNVKIDLTKAADDPKQISLHDDDHLMNRVANGDAAAFERLYDHHHRLVYGIAVRMLHDEAAAQDITQAVFTKVWAEPLAFRGGHFAAWLGRLTRNRCLDELRTSAHYTNDSPQGDSSGMTAESEAFAHLDAADVYGALAALPSEQREAIELAYFGGLTQTEIANKTATPLGTVKSRMRAGLLAMRNSLKGTRS